MYNTIFLDTYAIFEFLRGNPSYKKYQEVIGITTIFNIAELNYCLKKEFGDLRADEITEKYAECIVPVLVEDVKSAMTFRHAHKGLSIPDAIGYIVAKRVGSAFLTGDEGFRTLENVEFVKK